MVQNRLTVYTQPQEMQVALVKAIHLRRLLQHLPEPLQGLVLARQTTRFYIQTSEPLRVRVRQPLAIRQLVCTLLLERQLAQVLEIHLFPKCSHTLERHLLLVKALNLQMDFIQHQEALMAMGLVTQRLQLLLRLSEQHLPLGSEHPITRFSIQISERLRVLVRQLQVTKQLVCIRRQEQLLEVDLEAQVILFFIAIFVPQAHLVVRQLQMKRLVCSQL
jgi:hypothetical protein